MMDKQAFFAATKRGTSTHTLSDGTQVSIRSLSIGEREQIGRMSGDGGAADALCHIVAWGVDGLSEDDLEQIADMDSAQLKAIADSILALSGLSDDAVDDAKKA